MHEVHEQWEIVLLELVISKATPQIYACLSTVTHLKRGKKAIK